MEALSCILTSLIVSMGVFCGVSLGKIAKEELKPGKKYFIFLQNILIALAVLASVFYSGKPYLAVVSGVLIAARIISSRITREPGAGFYYISYAVFSILFFGAYGTGAFVLISSVIFLFGFPTGSMLFMKKGWIAPSAISALEFFLVSSALFILKEAFLPQ